MNSLHQSLPFLLLALTLFFGFLGLAFLDRHQLGLAILFTGLTIICSGLIMWRSWKEKD